MAGRGLQIGSGWGWVKAKNRTAVAAPVLATVAAGLWVTWLFGATAPGAIDLAGQAAEKATATGVVAQQTSVAGAAVDAASAAGAVGQQAEVEGAASVASAGAGAVAQQTGTEGAASDVVSATGDLDVSAAGISLAGTATAQSAATAFASVYHGAAVHYNNPIVWASPGGFFDVSGAFFSYTEFAPEQNTLFATKARSSGKLYIEFNCGGNLSESRYYFGFVAEGHGRSLTGPMPGFSAHSWALSTVGGAVYHDSTQIALAFPFTLLGNNTEIGFYYDYSGQFLRDGGIMRWAVDFDAGKMWAGYFDYENSHDVWDGDPAAGTDPTYTFTANTPLVPAIGIDFYNGVLQSTAWGGLSAHRGNYRAAPPSGFARWEEFANQTEVLADGPAGYWMAGPNSGRWITNSVGMTPGEADSSGNNRIADHYGIQSYAELTEEVRVMFPAQTPRAWRSTAINLASTYLCALSSGNSRTLECTIEITGAGATNAAGWKGGSGIACNYTNGPNRGAFSTSDRWFGLSLRDRRLIFGVGATEVVSSADLANGLYHVVCVQDVPAGTLTLYLNGVQDAQATGYTSGGQSSDYLAIGAIRPNATNGNFPGYLRDVAYYHSALPATRIAAHYARLLVAPMPYPIGSLVDGRTARFPYHTV